MYSNLSLLMCVIWYQTSLGSQNPKIIVYSTLPPALFPTKMGAALFLGKSLGDEAAVKYCPVQIVQTQTQPRPQALLAFQGEAR